jgi:5-methylcytosine-specific restriction endonuclease McrA
MTVNVYKRNVLLLNASYLPIRAITIRKAVDLLMKDTCIAVEGVAARLRTPSTIFEVPSVIRLRYYVNVPHRRATWSKRNVMRRDRFACVFCGYTIGDKVKGKRLTILDFTIDHLIPKSRGGGNTWGNTACACLACNHRKANRTPHEAGMSLLWEPKTPRTNYLIASGNVPAEWKTYLEMPGV